LNVKVNSSISGKMGITSSTRASYFDSDNDRTLKTLASYGCSVISDAVVVSHVQRLLRNYRE